MPAETHQQGLQTGPDEVRALVSALLDEGGTAARDATLASLGIGDERDLWDLWDTVCEEFGERTLGPIDGSDILDPSMILAGAAVVFAGLLGTHHGEDDEGADARPQ